MEFFSKNKIFSIKQTAFILLVSLSGCTISEYVDTDVPQFSDEVVTFASDISTYGTSSTVSNLQSNGFSMIACYTAQNNMDETASPNYMYNQPFTYNSGQWQYTPLKYWPNNIGDKLSFFAYSPANYVTTSSNASVGWPKIGIAVPQEPQNQKDVLVAQNINLTKQSNSITMSFKHIMSKVGFKMYKKNSQSVKIESATIEYKASTIISTSTYDYKTDVNSGTTTNYMTSGTSYSILTTETSITATTNATSQQINDNDKFMMFVPQDLSAQNDVMTLHLVYKIEDSSSSLDVSLPGFNFESGKQYTYVLSISGNDEVGITVIVEPWGEEVNLTSEGYVYDGLVLYLDGYDAPVANQWKDRSPMENDAIMSSGNYPPVYDATNKRYDFTSNLTYNYWWGGAAYFTLSKQLQVTSDATIEVVALAPFNYGNTVFHFKFVNEIWNDNNKCNILIQLNNYNNTSFSTYKTDYSFQSLSYDYSSYYNNFQTYYFKKGITEGQAMGVDGILKQSDASMVTSLNGPMVLCRIGATASFSNLFCGYIKCIRIYNRTLTQEELLNNFKADRIRFNSSLSSN